MWLSVITSQTETEVSIPERHGEGIL
jgi:hypothetical protein